MAIRRVRAAKEPVFGWQRLFREKRIRLDKLNAPVHEANRRPLIVQSRDAFRRTARRVVPITGVGLQRLPENNAIRLGIRAWTATRERKVAWFS